MSKANEAAKSEAVTEAIINAADNIETGERIDLGIEHEPTTSVCEECGNNISHESHKRNCSFKGAFARLLQDCGSIDGRSDAQERSR